MTTLVIVGAGASAFCSKQSLAAKQPPLGKDLYKELSEQYSEFRDIPEDIEALFAENFEMGFDALLAYGNSTKKLQPLLMLLQLGDYFVKYELNSVAYPKNEYFCLAKALMKKDIIYVSLNYELQLENALGILGFATSYRFNQQTPKTNRVVLKPHGSCNFMSAGNSITMENITIANASTSYETNDIHPYGLVEARRRISSALDTGNVAYAPVMSWYMKEKPSTHSPTFIANIRADYERAVKTSKRVVFIGVHCNPEDKHIWEPIAQANLPVGVINPEISHYRDWATERRLRPIRHIADTFGKCFKASNKLDNKFQEFLRVT
jgi:hypothetical protein